MDLVNPTPFGAVFLNTVVSENHLLGAVVVKAVFRVGGSELRPDPGFPWPVGADPVKTEFGELDGEPLFLRQGTDLIVLGRAYAPGGATARATIVEIRADRLHYRILVAGDRTWVRRGRDVVPSPTVPFESMPLTWDRAYGGKAKVEAGEMPYAANPEGRGFYMSAEEAEGKPLPNLEDPENPVNSWKDQPEPHAPGPYKREWSLRALRSAEFDTSGPVPRIKRIKPAYFNNANPRLVIDPPPAPGETVSVTGVRPGGQSLTFRLPEQAFHVYVQLHDRPYVFPTHLESIVVLAEDERVVLGHRCVFRYRMVPLERRAAVIREGPAPPSPPESYFIRWEEHDAAGERRA